MSRAIFISHSSKDGAAASLLASALESRGLSCWIAPRDISPGQNYASAIISGITGCSAMVVVVSENAGMSRHVLSEVETALNSGKEVIPVRLDQKQIDVSLNFFLSMLQWVDASGNPREQALTGAAERIQHAMAGGESNQGVVSPGPPPARARGVKPVLISAGVAGIAGLSLAAFAMTRNTAAVKTGAAASVTVPARPELIQFALSSSSVGYGKEKSEYSYSPAAQKWIEQHDRRIFSIAPTPPFDKPSRLVLLFTIRNPTEDDLLITDVCYDVHETFEVKSGIPGPVEPRHTYRHDIVWREGVQEHEMTPVYSIPAKTTLSFEIELRGRDTPDGAAMWLSIIFDSNLGSFGPDPFELFFPKFRSSPEMAGAGETSAVPPAFPGSPATSADPSIPPAAAVPRAGTRRLTMPPHATVMSAISQSDLKEDAATKGFDQLAMDLMFMAAAKNAEFSRFLESKSQIPGRRGYGELFAEAKLRRFWQEAQDYVESLPVDP